MLSIRNTAAPLLAFAAIFLCSCAGPEAEFYPLQKGGENTFGAPKNESDVSIYITKKPDYPYRELGMITLEASPSQADEPMIYGKLRAKAASIGADGIIKMNSQSSVEQMPTLSYDAWGAIVESNITRSVIKYRAMAIQKIGR